MDFGRQVSSISIKSASRLLFRVLCLGLTLFLTACLSSDSATVVPSAMTIVGTKVTTSYGTLLGKTVEAPSTASVKNSVISFLGIPYAQPPVGHLRWRPPQAPIAWQGERSATSLTQACVQGGSPTASLFSGEDCLYLNVYAPATPGPHPVMFWLHGGAFLIGAGSEYDGAALAREQDVVVVTVNYRLSFFGFLAAEALSKENGDGSSGNQGFYDQLAALKWVKQEISQFGGDAGNITVFGQSAGGVSTCLLMASPLTDGLFQRAIMQSGHCDLEIFPRQTVTTAEAKGSEFFAKLGCASESPTLNLFCARTKSTQDILNALNIPYNELFSKQPVDWKYLPSVVIDGTGKMFPKDPSVLLAEGAKSGMPVLIGTTKDEGSLFYELKNNPGTEEGYFAELEQQRVTMGAPPSALTTLKTLYPYSAYETSGQALSAIAGDMAFHCTTRTVADTLSTTNHSVYSYNFIQPVSGLTYAFLSMQRGQNSSDIGVFHVSDVPYVFAETSIIGSLDTAERQETSRKMSTYWANFARTGNPNANGLPTWLQYTQASPAYLEIGGTFASKSAFRQQYCDFWNSL